MSHPENLNKVELMKILSFQAKKAMKGSGAWTDAVNDKFAEVVRQLLP